MILFLSYEGLEQGTNPIIDWLIFKRANVCKVHLGDILNPQGNVTLMPNEGKLMWNGEDVLSDVNVICYRRLYDGIYNRYFEDSESKFKYQVIRELKGEISDVIKFLFDITSNKAWFPPPNVNNVNKLTMLMKARNFGLNVPDTIITNSRSQLVKFLKKHNEAGIITKPINRSGYYIDEDMTYSSYTTTITAKMISDLPEKFPPSLFQSRCRREYEIRAFYLDGDFYSVAGILPEESLVDIKRSFKKATLQWMVYELPAHVKHQIDSFMKNIGLNTGSLDIIKEIDNTYTFIEVNPVGQYGAPSYQGNFRIEEKIADWLIKHDQ